MKVRLNDGREAIAHQNYSGKLQQITVDGRQLFWPRDKMEEITAPQPAFTKIPAIDRLDELLRYGKAGVETSPDYWKLVTELREEAKQERIKEWGV